MSKLNQIQNTLLELSGGAFQRLADAYLHKKGYQRINPLGSVIGRDKVKKGTPDTLVPLPNGKYVFAEYTTQQTGVYGKLKDDLDKCFDESKTGVSIDDIAEVVFCHTSLLSPEEEIGLSRQCQKHGVNLNVFGIGPISYDLYQKYPGIARDFLGIEVDTGQIVFPDEFVSAHNKNKLTTRLNTAFHFRQEEVERVLEDLQNVDLVIVSGRPGVGKTRLALECSRRFTEAHPEYEIKCVFNRGVNLFEDLRVHLSEPGNYLLFVDDANRVSRFEYVVQLLQDQNDNLRIKVITTVRDYAIDKVREAARLHGSSAEIEIETLKEEQIKQLVKDECGIRHHLYLGRIADIAQGNPRLAIMAAEVANRENTLESIGDVSALYDEYFVSIRRDLEELGDRELLKAAGIIAFFQAIDRSNDELMTSIGEAFSMAPEAFWNAACRLHDLEICEMYENELVRFSDQVLATYMFYLVFFKEKTLSFSGIIKHFFPRFRERIVDSINPAMNAFDIRMIMEVMRPHVDIAWKSMKERGDEEGLLELMGVFWFLKDTDTLLYIRDQIEKMEQTPVNLCDVEFKASSGIPSPSFLSILASFRYAGDPEFRIALGLVLDYLAKRPGELPQVLYLLIDLCGFTHTSYARGFKVQQSVIDILWERARDGDEFFSNLFFAVIRQYVHTHFLTHESKDARSIRIIKFDLPPTDKLFQLRQGIWRRLFQLYSKPNLQEGVLGVLRDYSTSGYTVSVKKIVMRDALLISPFIEKNLDSSRYEHCALVHDYLSLLELRGVEFPKELQQQFRSEIFTTSELLLLDWAERRNLNVSHNKYRQDKKRRIKEYFADHDLDDYKQFFEFCSEIQAGLDRANKKQKRFQLQNGVIDVLLALADRDPDLYATVLQHYLSLGEPLELNSGLLIEKLIKICGAERALELVSRPDYPTKRSWLFGYYLSLPTEDNTSEGLDQLYALYRTAEIQELPHGFDFLLKYRSLNDSVVARVVKILLNRLEQEPKYASAFSMLFNPHTEVNKSIIELFDNHIGLLKRAYFAMQVTQHDPDYDGGTFSRILDLDPDFILEYLDQMFDGRAAEGWNEDNRDYSFLWMRDDYMVLMTRVAESIYEREKQWTGFLNTGLENFFGLGENAKDSPEIKRKQNLFLESLIKQRHHDLPFMKLVFNLIAEFPSERRLPFIALFLEHNNNYEDFRRLPLEPSSGTWWGSAVPRYQSRMEYFESLLPLLNTVEFLQHKRHIQQRIQRIRLEIEREKKRDFIQD